MSRSRLRRRAGQSRDAGPDEIALADTIGVAVPCEVRRGWAWPAGGRRDVPLRAAPPRHPQHGRGERGGGLDAGVDVAGRQLRRGRRVPLRPRATGNVATEDLVYLLDRMGPERGWTWTPTPRRWIGERLGKTLPGALLRAGGFPRP